MPPVPTADLLRDFERYRDIAQREPLTIGEAGDKSLTLMSTEEYHRLRRRDREAVLMADMGPEFLAALEKAEVAEEYDHLNTLLDDDR